jgi:hypothetical protein
MRRFPCLAVFVLLFGLCAPANAEVASVLILAGDPLQGSPPGHTISALNNTAVNHSLGFAVTVNTSDGVNTLSHAWGGSYLGTGSLLRTETTVGTYEQTSWESFFGIDDLLNVAYSPMCTDTVSGTTGLDAVYLESVKVMIEEDPYPPQPTTTYWSFGSRPGATATGVPYFVGGITNTPGGTTQNRGLFYGNPPLPLLLGGGFVVGLPDPLSTSSTVSFDYRFSASGSHYIAEVQTTTGSTLNDNHMVIDGAVIMAGGQPISENGMIPTTIGGLPGELWDNFDFAGVTDDMHWMFTGDTNADVTLDEIVVVDGVILHREGDTLDGEVLSGSIEGAYMNEDADVAFIWDIQAGTIEALYLNSRLVLQEGDEVDITGDGIPDPGAVLEDFSGISSLTMTDRDPVGGNVRLYFTATVNVPPMRVASRPGLMPGSERAIEMDAEACGLEDVREVSSDGRDGRVSLEGAFVLVGNPNLTNAPEPLARPGSRRAGLLQVSPNPVRSDGAWIVFDVPRAGPVTLAVYDLAGRRVRTLDSGQRLAGERTVRWDGRDDLGNKVAAGSYFVRYRTGEETATERVVLVR